MSEYIYNRCAFYFLCLEHEDIYHQKESVKVC